MDNERTALEDAKQAALDLKEERLLKQQDDDLKDIASSPQGARRLLDKINEMFKLKLYTGNAGTHFNLGMWQSTINEINAVMVVLEQETYTGLIVYLTEQSKGRNHEYSKRD